MSKKTLDWKDGANISKTREIQHYLIERGISQCGHIENFKNDQKFPKNDRNTDLTAIFETTKSGHTGISVRLQLSRAESVSVVERCSLLARARWTLCILHYRIIVQTKKINNKFL